MHIHTVITQENIPNAKYSNRTAIKYTPYPSDVVAVQGCIECALREDVL